MLKASSSGIVLTRLAQSTSQAILARPFPHPLPRFRFRQWSFPPQSRSSSFSARFVARVSTAAIEPVNSYPPDPAAAPAPIHASHDAGEKRRSRNYMPSARVVVAREDARPTKKDRGETDDLHGKAKAKTAQLCRHRKSVPHGYRKIVKNAKGGQSKGKTTVRNDSSTVESSKLEDLARSLRKDVPEHGRSLREIKDYGEEHSMLSVRELRAIIFDRSSDVMGEAWNAYQQLALIEADDDFHNHHYGPVSNDPLGGPLLPTLAKRLVNHRKYHQKNGREVFLRLLSVYARLRRVRARADGIPHLRTAEWNTLVHFAGTGLRGRLSLDAYNAALDVYDDMLRGVDEARNAGLDPVVTSIEPDIYTYTTLLNIALRSEHQPIIDHAVKLLEESKKEPTRVTQLCMMRYRYRVEGLAGVRAVLASLGPENVGGDGITAFMECAAYEGDLTLVRNLYTALRQNLKVNEDGTYGPFPNELLHEKDTSDGVMVEDKERYVTVGGVRLLRTLVPTAAVYNCVIGLFAYHGLLSEALHVFTEMLTTRRPPPDGGFFQPSYAVFRAMFLGFARHGDRLDHLSKRRLAIRRSEWTYDRFSIILDSFLELGDTMAPSERMVFWIMTSVRKMTGDERLCVDVWHRLNARWHIRKGGRLKDLDMRYGK